jgi:hypothetical protein
MRMFRQERLLEWPPVFEQIAQELTALVPPDLRALDRGAGLAGRPSRASAPIG